MPRRSLPVPVLLAAGLSLIPALAHADLRIEEQSTALDSKVIRWTAIKGNKRAIVTRAEVKGLLYDAGARYGAYVEIARPDRDLLWELDPQERSYREIPGEAFGKLLQKGIQIPRNPDDQPLRSLYRSQTTAIEVAPTGKTRRIAGLDAEQVIARVVVGAQNLVSGNQFTFTFDQEIWITRDDRVLKEVRGFEEAYSEAFGTAATLQQAQVLAGEWNDAFITHLRAVNDRVRALGGFPLSVSTTVTEEALAQAKNEKSNARKLVVGSTEVRKLTFESIPDSEFELPVGYINQDTKVAVAPRAGSAPSPEAPSPPTPASQGMPAATQGTPTVAQAQPMPEAVKPPTAVASAGTPAGTQAPSPMGKPATVSPPAVAASTPSMPTTSGSTSASAPVASGSSPSAATHPGAGASDPVESTLPSPAQSGTVAAAPTRVRRPAANSAATSNPSPFGGGDQPVYVSSAPSNVIVNGAPSARQETRHSKGHRQPVEQAPEVASGGGTPFVSYTTTQAPPPPVTIDEPEYIHQKKKKKH